MPRYIAFLRGVSPLNAKMPDLKHAFELAGFSDVKTILSSGNVAFTTRTESESSLARQAEASMAKHLGHAFYTIVRPSSFLAEMIEANPYATSDIPASAKRIVTFVGEPSGAHLGLPVEVEDGRILALYGNDVLSAYLSSRGGTTVLTWIEKQFTNRVTTRTWETVKRCAVA